MLFHGNALFILCHLQLLWSICALIRFVRVFSLYFFWCFSYLYLVFLVHFSILADLGALSLGTWQLHADVAPVARSHTKKGISSCHHFQWKYKQHTHMRDCSSLELSMSIQAWAFWHCCVHGPPSNTYVPNDLLSRTRQHFSIRSADAKHNNDCSPCKTIRKTTWNHSGAVEI